MCRIRTCLPHRALQISLLPLHLCHHALQRRQIGIHPAATIAAFTTLAAFTTSIATTVAAIANTAGLHLLKRAIVHLIARLCTAAPGAAACRARHSRHGALW